MSDLPPCLPTDPPPALSAQQRARLLQRLRRGLAALSVVGAALVALPMAQLMRYQSAELKTLAARRASLDPVARAVSLQRGLLAHAELAAQVLRGRSEMETDRRQRQGEVDARMAALNVALVGGRWDLAMGEADDLRNDWLQLARQVQQRQIGAADSDEAHRLLVEQTLQVIDLVTTAGRDEHAGASLDAEGLPGGTASAVRALPRLVWMTSRLQHSDGTAAPAERARGLQAALERTLRTVQRSGADAPLAAAAQAAATASARYFDLLKAGSASAPDLRAAARDALQAQMRLFDIAYGQASGALAAQSRALAQRRALLLGGLCFGVLIALGLVAALRRDLRRLAGDDQRRADELAAPPASDGQSGGRHEAAILLERLRDTTPEASLPAAPSAVRAETDAES